MPKYDIEVSSKINEVLISLAASRKTTVQKVFADRSALAIGRTLEEACEKNGFNLKELTDFSPEDKREFMARLLLLKSDFLEEIA